MKIAQIAPLWESIPPKTYGGTELVVAQLSEQLVKLGHTVTLFASSCNSPALSDIPLVSVCQKPLRELDISSAHALYYEMDMLEAVFKRANEFDVIHNHVGFQALCFASLVSTPVVTTLHGVFTPEPMKRFLENRAHLPYVSISHFQRIPSPALNYVANIYHGIAIDTYPYDTNPENKDYLVFLGRFSPEKGPHLAIQVAKALGLKLIMAGKLDIAVDNDYYQTAVAPHVDGSTIINIGEVDFDQKVDLLKNARAVLCPVTWPEPFGLVLIEALACGTPVMALRHGSIPEVIKHGVTGYVADTVEELTAYTQKSATISRKTCRQFAETHFTSRRMAEEYIQVYQDLLSSVSGEAPQSGRYAVNTPG